MNVSDKLPLPHRGITLLPPWPWAILCMRKRLESRPVEVAKRVGSWRGTIAITQSKVWHDINDHVDALAITARGWLEPDDIEMLRDEKQWLAWAGKLVGVAELIDIREPALCAGNRWHVPGYWGLILGRVWEVEPVAIRGGHDIWFTGICCACGLLQAVEGRANCRRCKQKVEGAAWQRRALSIVRECLP